MSPASLDVGQYFRVLHRVNHQQRVASKTTTFASMWPGVPSHAQTNLDLLILPYVDKLIRLNPVSSNQITRLFGHQHC